MRPGPIRRPTGHEALTLALAARALIAARFVQGVGGAASSAVILAMIVSRNGTLYATVLAPFTLLKIESVKAVK